MTSNMQYVTSDIWHMTNDMWHMVVGEHYLKMLSSLALLVKERQWLDDIFTNYD